MKVSKKAHPLIAAELPNKGNRMVYEYRIRHVDWQEKSNITGRFGPFSFINLQYKVYPPHHFFPSHSHAMYEFYSVIKGRVVMSVGTRKQVPVELGAGSAAIMAPHQIHTASSERPAAVVNVHFVLRGPIARKKALANICGRRLHISKDTRARLASLSKLPADKTSGNSARVLKSEFNCILEAMLGEGQKK